MQIIKELHDNDLGGHFGKDKTMAMVAEGYSWPKMYMDVVKVGLKVSNLPIWYFTKH